MSFSQRHRQLLIASILTAFPAVVFAADDAQIVSADLPSALDCNAQTTATVTVINTGTTTWTADVFKLGAVGDSDHVGGPSRIYLPDGTTVPPGSSHAFTFTLTAPSTEQIATTDWQMVHEGVAWFGGIASRNVSVTCSPDIDNAQIVSSSLPAELVCGQSFDASVTVRNTGGTTWTADVYKLGRNGDDDDLGGPARIYLPHGTEVQPGSKHTFDFTLTAPPEPGIAVTDWRMVHEGLAWFGGTASRTVPVNCSNPVDDAIVVDANLPDFLQCGEDYSATVTMRNTGTTPWTSDVYMLGAVGDADLLGGPLRAFLPNGTTIPPGGQHTFDFTLSGPYDLEGAPSKWQMVHDGVAWFGSIASTWADLDCFCSDGGCEAGCAHLPTFTVSTTRIPTHESVTFTVANPDTILDELPNWDFGDGNHCDHCPRTVTHRYNEPGVYKARLTATESQCNTVTVSKAVNIEVFDHAVPRQNAEILEKDLPTALCSNTVQARITVKNTGHGVWVPGEFFLGAVGNFDPFSESARIPLTREVAPQEVHTFEFPLRPAEDGCPFSPCRTEWQMVWEHHSWFGGTAREDIDIGECTTEGTGDYVCRASVTDEYTRPLPGKAVVLETFIYGEDKWEVVDRAFSVTDPNGLATVNLDVDEPAIRLRCLVDLQSAGRNTTAYVIDHEGIPSGKEIYVEAVAVPEPTFSVGVVGLKGASAVGHLYQSGQYDRVFVIPEPINTEEVVRGPRGREGLWKELELFMTELYRFGFDVWVVNPPTTGQNIHEQAAELAQIIEYATTRYPATHGAGPAFDGQAAAIGISLGGVVTRIATSRWESRASEDAAWRRQLGLADTLPLKLIVFVDSPLRGANVPTELQSFLWKPFGFPKSQAHEINMNSCAFQQLVKETSWQLVNCSAGFPNPTCNWRAFYEDGREVRFPGSGNCDSRVGDVCICDPGPAVFSINGDGFAHGPRTIAYSDGKYNEPIQCYGDEKDLTRDGKNMCGSQPRKRRLFAGDEWLKFDVNNFSDKHFRLSDSDLVAGSRLTSLDGRKFKGVDFILADKIKVLQYSSPAFIPRTSSWGTGGEGCAFDACRENDFNGAHVNPSKASQGWIFKHVMEAFGIDPSVFPDASQASGPYTGTPGETLALNTTSVAPDASISWNLGDGTVRSGASVQHTYDRAGIYPVELSIERDGQTTIARTLARIGVPENNPPVIDEISNQQTGLGEPLELAATVSDIETTVTRTSWSFGDGEYGEGSRTTHAWSEPGTYTVIFSASDDEGAFETAEFYVAVGTPTSPVPVAPVLDGVGVFPTFTWKPVDSATSYTLRAIGDSGASSRQLSVDPSKACRATSCEATFGESFEIGDHHWSVTAANEFGEGPPSDWSKFRVQTSRNNPPTVEIEADGTCGATCTIDFTAFAHDSDGDDLDFAWAGCANGFDTSLMCEAAGPGSVDAALSVTDGRGATATADCSVPIFVASYSTGEWGECSATCGGGTQFRTVNPSTLTMIPPGIDPPPGSRACNTQKCALTCADYTNMYPRKYQCYGAGWRVCERRYRSDGVGGTLRCWKGFK